MQVLAIVGPSGTGKSALALELAGRLDGEILTCDSVQLYRGYDIGSAKPSPEELARRPHHLIDLVDCCESFDAGAYGRAARLALAEIGRRGRVPILCGGTGLYLRTLRWGLLDLPVADAALRGRLADAESADPGSTLRRLRVVDPASAERIESRNTRQLLRALEIYELSGSPASALRAAHAFAGEEVPMKVVVVDRPDAELRDRLRQRAEQMLARGLLGETDRLLGPSRQHRGCRPMGSVGYRQAAEVLTGLAPEAGLAARIATATWDYVRRQRTWFRKERQVQPLVLTDERGGLDALAQILGV